MGNCHSLKNVNEINNDSFKKFSLNGLYTQCKILSVYDGDTCTVGFLWKNELYSTKVRMLGYDSPEMKPPKSQENRELEIEAAKKAKQFLIDNTEGKTLYVEFGEFDKYGRPLATIYIHNRNKCCCIPISIGEEIINVNQLMISSGHGYEYNGGTKKLFNIIT